jgi:hypothetical protein
MCQSYSNFGSVGTTDRQWPKNALLRSVKGSGSSVRQYIDYGPGSRIRQRQEIFCSPQGPDMLWGPPGRSLGSYSDWGLKLTTHLIYSRGWEWVELYLYSVQRQIYLPTPHIRTIVRLCALFKASSGERAWKVIRYRLWRAYCLSRVGQVRKTGTGSKERL